MKTIRMFAAACLGLLPIAVQAQPAATLARDGLEKRLAAISDQGPGHGFETGMLQTLRAVEKTLQARYEYGLGEEITDLPVLRLEFGGLANPAPKTQHPETLTRIISTFVADVRQAQATLNGAEVRPFELNLQDLWFDIDSDGVRSEHENAVSILAPAFLNWRALSDAKDTGLLEAQMPIRFDTADHEWLLAYTYLLTGFGSAFTAFDPAPVFKDLARQRAAMADAPQIEQFYDPAEVKADIAALEAELSEAETRMDPLSEQIKQLRAAENEIWAQIKAATSEAKKTELRAELQQLQQDITPLNDSLNEMRRSSAFLRGELQAAKAKLPEREQPGRSGRFMKQSTLDALYVTFAALRQQPDPNRIRAARDDWKAMIAHNRAFWSKLELETDNDREWIPNPDQQSALPFTLPPGTAEAWQRILSDAEAVLEGKLLIPHPQFPAGYGINAAAYFDDPSPLNLLDWLHGIGAYRYAARGPLMTGQSWRAFNRLTRGNATGFALFLN
ncbi:MAG: hypothetical protein AB3N24_00575 [Leisingera sp.]